MKKLITICILLATVFTINAQETKKVFIVFETQSYTVKNTENGKDVWKPEIPYKNYVRIIISPFDVPIKYDSNNGLSTAMANQIAEFAYKSHLKEFEKLKLHNLAFNFSVRDYNTRSYDNETKDCKDCTNQHEKIIIDGFQFKPIEEKFLSKIYMDMNRLFTGKK
jgi:hypothetical protein